MELLLAVIVGLHLLAVNFCSAAPLICIWLDRRAGRGDLLAYKAGRWFAVWAVNTLLLGAMLGLLAGWLIWSDQYRAVVGRLASKIHFGVWELLFSLVLMAGYIVLWRSAQEPGGKWRWLRSSFAFLASTNLLYHFPFLMFVMSRLATGDDPGHEPITASMFRQMMIEPDVLANSCHFVLAALATSGIGLMVFAIRGAARATLTSEESHRAGLWGARIALVPTLLQLPVGMWVFAAQPALTQSRLMGGSVLAVGSLVLGVFAAIALMNQLATLAFGQVDLKQMRKAVALFIAIVMLMTASLRSSNTRELTGQTPPAATVFVQR